MITQDKIKSWLKDPHNFILVLILLASFIYRLYYFFITKDQPLWYDEADYLNTSRYWAFGTPFWGFAVVRPVLFAFIFSMLYKIGFSELTFRIIIFLISMGAILLMYLVGKEMYNKKVGLIASFILAVFWSFSFFSYRILVDVPVAFFWLLALYFFLKYYGKDNKKLWIFAVFLALGFMAKFTVALLGFVILLYILAKDRSKIFKNKHLWIALITLLVILIPLFIFEYLNFGNPLAFFIKVASTPQPVDRTFFQSVYDFTRFSVPLVHSVFFIILVISLIFVVGRFLLYSDFFIKRKSQDFDSDFLLILWLVIPFAYIAKIGYGYYIEERWLFMFYPALFIVIARGLEFFYGYWKKYSKTGIIIVICLLLAIGGYQNIKNANEIIQIKKDSFIQVKQAGEWLKQNTAKEEVLLVTSTHAELQYHADRTVINTGDLNNNTELDRLIKEGKTRYYVISLFFPVPESQIAYLQNRSNLFLKVKEFPVSNQDSQPIVTILQVNDEAKSQYGLG